MKRECLVGNLAIVISCCCYYTPLHTRAYDHWRSLAAVCRDNDASDMFELIIPVNIF